MRCLFSFALLLIPLGMAMIGCSGSNQPPAAPTDVTLHVPGMY